MAAARRQHKTRRSVRNAHGFTLIELMIAISVLVVLLIATSASLGIFSPKSSRADLHDATSTLLDQLEFARVRASMLNTATEVRFQLDGDPQLITVLDHTTSNCLGTPVTEPARQIRFSMASTAPGGWTGGDDGPMYGEVTMLSVLPEGLGGLCFRPDGRVTRPNGLVIEAPGGNDLLAAGEAQISLRMRMERDLPTAVTHNVIVPYNGLAKVQYEIP